MTTHQHREPLSVDLASIVDVINARDDARAMAALWKETARRAIQSNAFLDSAAAMEQQMAMSESLVAAEAIKRAEKAEQERDEWMRRALDCATAEPRPLTADDITDEMVQRAGDASGWPSSSALSGLMRRILTAALTPPPSRPEGAEEIEAYMRELVASHPEDHYGKLADHLASRGVLPPLTDKSEPSRGVRVTGAES